MALLLSRLGQARGMQLLRLARLPAGRGRCGLLVCPPLRAAEQGASGQGPSEGPGSSSSGTRGVSTSSSARRLFVAQPRDGDDDGDDGEDQQRATTSASSSSSPTAERGRSDRSRMVMDIHKRALSDAGIQQVWAPPLGGGGRGGGCGLWSAGASPSVCPRSGPPKWGGGRDACMGGRSM